MLEPVSYLPLGIVAGIMFLAVWEIFSRIRKDGIPEERRSRKWIYFLAVVYMAVLLKLALFSREPGSRTSVDMWLFATWGDNAVSHAYFIENIFLFIPFGILLPMGFRRMQKGGLCVLAGFLASAALETVQLLTERGHCQLDDVVTNTAGAAVGWGIYRLWEASAKKERKRAEAASRLKSCAKRLD